MRHTQFILFAILMFTSFLIYAQPENQGEHPKYRDVFCQIIVEQRFMSNKMKMHIDYGNQSNLWIGTYAKVRDEQSGKIKNFNSAVDALNYMTEEGWTYVHSFVVENQTSMGNMYAYYYLLKRQIPFEGL